MNKHTRPFRCMVAGCRGAKGFATKGVLDRHVHLVHERARSGSSETSRVVGIEDASTETNVGDIAPARVDKGIGRAKRTSPEDTVDQCVSEGSGESMTSSRRAKKAKNVDQRSSNTQQIGQLEVLVKENEELKQHLEKANEEMKRVRKDMETLEKELERCQKEKEQDRRC